MPTACCARCGRAVQVQWGMLPGLIEVLNVHVPHYSYMFEQVLSGEPPWYFGHLLLPGAHTGACAPTTRAAMRTVRVSLLPCTCDEPCKPSSLVQRSASLALLGGRRTLPHATCA